MRFAGMEACLFRISRFHEGYLSAAMADDSENHVGGNESRTVMRHQTTSG
jgi:hypothetical protein